VHPPNRAFSPPSPNASSGSHSFQKLGKVVIILQAISGGPSSGGCIWRSFLESQAKPSKTSPRAFLAQDIFPRQNCILGPNSSCELLALTMLKAKLIDCQGVAHSLGQIDQKTRVMCSYAPRATTAWYTLAWHDIDIHRPLRLIAFSGDCLSNFIIRA
jgi:hypothetical protein